MTGSLVPSHEQKLVGIAKFVNGTSSFANGLGTRLNDSYSVEERIKFVASPRLQRYHQWVARNEIATARETCLAGDTGPGLPRTEILSAMLLRKVGD
jgi:hypothetical protein